MAAQRHRPRLSSRVATLIVALVAVAGLLVTIWAVTSGSSGDATVVDPVTITTLDADYQVDAAGTLLATETITAEFPPDRHGVYRYFDQTDPADPQARYGTTVLTVERDGVAEPYSTSVLGTVLVVKIGDPDQLLDPGTHTYRIAYRVPGVLGPLRPLDDVPGVVTAGPEESARSLFAWWVVAPGWEMPIRAARAQVQLPAPSVTVRCRVGGEAAASCVHAGAGTSSITVTATGLPPRSGVELAATTTAATSVRAVVPWSASLDPVLGTSAPTVGLVVLLAAVLALLARLWVVRAEERAPAAPVQYAPPDGLGPVQVVYLATESTGDQALTATVLHLAERGLVRLEHSGSTWQVERVAGSAEWDATDPVTHAVGRALELDEPGAVFRMQGDEATGARINKAVSALERAIRSWALDGGLWRRSPWEWVGRVLVVASLLAAGIVGLSGPVLWGLPLAAFAVAGAGLLATGTTRRRTTAAREMWVKALGFQRLLTTSSNEDRLDYAARADVWTSYLPYAVAFGAADAWAEKYRAATGREAPVPSWYPASAVHVSVFHPDGAGIGGFDESVNASVAAYTAAHGGGGGAGGGGGFGGGGGGGGGSW